jgi:hypothetical protein
MILAGLTLTPALTCIRHGRTSMRLKDSLPPKCMTDRLMCRYQISLARSRRPEKQPNALEVTLQKWCSDRDRRAGFAATDGLRVIRRDCATAGALIQCCKIVRNTVPSLQTYQFGPSRQNLFQRSTSPCGSIAPLPCR